MPRSWSSSAALIPFGYTLVTRIGGGRDLGYLVASAWVPGAWVTWRLGGEAWVWAPGYLAFIALYELGYFVNDAWDAHRTAQGRRRITWAIPPLWIAGFVGLRLGLWAGVGLAMGWIAQPLWLAGYAALAVVFALHNWVQPVHLRLASFAQLAVLRFLLPGLGALPGAAVPLALVLAGVTYAWFRGLSYLDGKAVLDLPARRAPGFGLGQTLMFLPLMALLGFAAGTSLPLELAAYFGVLYAGYAGLRRG